MSEKIKAMFGNAEREDEVRDWLLAQGMRDDYLAWSVFSCEKSIYSVHEGSLHVMSGTFSYLFDIVELPPKHKFKPFDKVLVRDFDHDIWRCSFYSHFNENSLYPHICVYAVYKCCIPYEGNEHLAGTRDIPKGGKL